MKDHAEKKITVTFQMSEEIVNLIDEYAKILGLSRAKMIRNLIACGLQDAKVLKATYLMDIIGLIRGTKQGAKVEVNYI